MVVVFGNNVEPQRGRASPEEVSHRRWILRPYNPTLFSVLSSSVERLPDPAAMSSLPGWSVSLWNKMNPFCLKLFLSGFFFFFFNHNSKMVTKGCLLSCSQSLSSIPCISHPSLDLFFFHSFKPLTRTTPALTVFLTSHTI